MHRTLAAARAWLADDPDPETRASLQNLLSAAEGGDAGAGAELVSAFAGPLTFGTAGLRGAMGPGPARMNRLVVGQAAVGFGEWLARQGLAGGQVIVGFDARHKSREFALETARLLAGRGFRPVLTEDPAPTPVVAFGIRHLGCVAGIVVTASHNPPQDNGYKVYLGDGSQIIPPADAEIEACIREIEIASLATLPRSDDFRTIGAELLAEYVAHAVTLVPDDAPRDLVWVHTAMHGVGAGPMRAVALAAGFPAPAEVAEQAAPDPDFPTVAFPNPEEAGAIDLALARAEAVAADVVVANDPDADRCAVAAVVDGGWRMLTGDELGGLLGHYALDRGVEGVYANSVVSSTLLRSMALAAGREHRTTLTGFKWIGRVPGLGFGYEEAIGYCCDPGAVPDKDGLTAGLFVLRLVAELKAAGLTLQDRLDEIAATYGLHATSQLSVRVEKLQEIADAMARLRANPPTALLGEPVRVDDLASGSAELPATDAVELTGARVHVVVRPSGTEPKLKCYLEVRFTPEESADGAAARVRGAEQLAVLRDEMARVLGI